MEVLLQQIGAQKNERVKLRTLLHGLIGSSGVIAQANRDGVQSTGVNRAIAAEIPMIDQYCDAVLGTGEPQTMRAGGSTGSAGAGEPQPA